MAGRSAISMGKTIRIGIAGLTQESNTFAPAFSTRSDFVIEEGERVVDTSQGTNTEVGGFIDALNRLAVEPIPLLSGWAISAGPVDDETFSALAEKLAGKVRDLELDGLLLALHGAWLSASYPSADAELVRRIRMVTGERLPIVVTLDSHANVTPALLSQVNGVVGYRTYPHVDMADCGRKAARLLFEIVTERVDTRMYWMPAPILAPPQSATTDRPPLRDVLDRLDRELPGEVVSSSLFYVQPWLDMPGVNSGLLAVARSENAAIETTLQSIAQEWWDRRAEFQVEWVQPERLVDEVFRETLRPVIVSEAFDGTSGGACGDHPGLLSILLPEQERLSACVHIVDPVAAERAFQAGVGGVYEGLLGANRDTRFGPPLDVKARVRHLSDGEFVLKGPVFTGRRVSMGPTAVLEAGNIQVVAGSRAVFTIDPELYRSQGIEPAGMDVVAVKSPTLFRPGYSSMLGRVLHLDMPGVCRGNLKQVPFKHLDHPTYPLDDFEWKAAECRVMHFRRSQN